VYKLIGIVLAAAPIALFLRAIFKGQLAKRSQELSDFKKQMDYLVWVILLLIGCGVVYSTGKLIYQFLTSWMMEFAVRRSNARFHTSSVIERTHAYFLEGGAADLADSLTSELARKAKSEFIAHAWPCRVFTRLMAAAEGYGFSLVGSGSNPYWLGGATYPATLRYPALLGDDQHVCSTSG
jgi:hypothetical protein